MRLSRMSVWHRVYGCMMSCFCNNCVGLCAYLRRRFMWVLVSWFICVCRASMRPFTSLRGALLSGDTNQPRNSILLSVSVDPRYVGSRPLVMNSPLIGVFYFVVLAETEDLLSSVQYISEARIWPVHLCQPASLGSLSFISPSDGLGDGWFWV